MIYPFEGKYWIPGQWDLRDLQITLVGETRVAWMIYLRLAPVFCIESVPYRCQSLRQIADDLQ